MELELGVLAIERKDAKQGAALRSWLEQHVLPEFADRTLSVDTAVAQRCAQLHVPDKRGKRDALRLIELALGNSSEWVLIGGPPCQAYSMAGRSRMRSGDPKKFEQDKRHLLYEQYLRILRKFGPSIFVMENVKGILTSRLGGSLIFDRILSDLSNPGNGLQYQIRSFVTDGQDLDPIDFLIQSEDYGLPQARHRVILFGIRSDIAETLPIRQDNHRFLLTGPGRKVTVAEALAGMPALRSKLSREKDTHESWLSALKEAKQGLKMWRHHDRQDIEDMMIQACIDAKSHPSSGGLLVEGRSDSSKMPEALCDWLEDPRLPGVLQHETRSHMRSDLGRYLFAACYAKLIGRSPKLNDFPPRLLPMHSNIFEATIPFLDRFRVQRGNEPSTTIVSHIAKDGHYYIHHDPSQCRSLTVREAARLQTFPDNYFFEGNRTEQYWQVGNAVPPLLARQIAEIVLDMFNLVRSQTYEKKAYG